MKPRQMQGRGERGMTLIEVLVVLVIVGLLVGIIAPRAIDFLGSAQKDTAVIQMKQLNSALDIFKLDTGRYPSAIEGLGALMSSPVGVRGWNGPYLTGAELPKDPWGYEFIYSTPGPNGQPFQISSFGADGREGGEGNDADITLP